MPVKHGTTGILSVGGGGASKESLAVSNRTKHILTMQSATIPLDIYPREFKPFVHLGSFKIAKTHRQPRCRWMDKRGMVYPFGDMFLSLKINNRWSHKVTRRNFECIITMWKGCTLSDSNSVATLWERWNYGDLQRCQWLARAKGLGKDR